MSYQAQKHFPNLIEVKAKYQAGMIRTEIHHESGIEFKWMNASDCVKRGQFVIDGRAFPIGYPKIEFVMDHFGGADVTKMIKDRLEIKNWNEMFGERRIELLAKYRALLDELVELVNSAPSNQTRTF